MRTRLPLLANLALLWGLTAVLTAIFLSASGAGRVVYALDDPYIHMAMARNLAEHGVYGVTRHAFSSSSSSPAWVLLLTGGYALAGVREDLPLLLALLSASLAVSAADRICRAHGLTARARGVVLLVLVLATPLVPLVMTGMETALQVAVDLLFVHTAVRRLGPKGDVTSARSSRWLWLLTPLVTAVRVEGVFLVAVIAVLLLVQRRWREVVVLAGLGALPLIVYAAVAHTHGAPLLPNPVLAKASLPAGPHALTTFLRQGLESFRYHPDLLLTVVAALALWIRSGRVAAKNESGRLWLLIFAAASILHAQFARIGAMGRYEAYLMALGIVALGLNLPGLAHDLRGRHPQYADAADASGRWPARAAWAMLAFCIAAPFMPRLTTAFLVTPRAMRNIHQQQYQVGLFLREHYQGRTIVANDIGAIDFLADIDVLDVVGLADPATLRHRLERGGDTDWLADQAAARGAVVAIVYRDWLESEYGRLPATWQPVGSWTIPGNVACAGATVDFLGLGAAAADSLRLRLAAFAPLLPPAVGVHVMPAAQPAETTP